MGREKLGIPQSVRAELDFYATNPADVREIMEIMNYPKDIKILEPCAGNGHISETLMELGYENVYTNDIIKREIYLNSEKDFLNEELDKKDFDLVVLNPPFRFAQKFIEKSLEYAEEVLVIGRLDLLETKSRKDLNNNHLVKVFVHSKRARFAKNGVEEAFKDSTSISTAWLVYRRNKDTEATIRII